MARTPALPTLTLERLGPIRRASLEFGDLTVLVGPQASGKSIALQMLKLVMDHAAISARLRREGFDWRAELPTFLDLYFGEGMRNIWERGTAIWWKGVTGGKNRIELDRLVGRKVRGGKSSACTTSCRPARCHGEADSAGSSRRAASISTRH